MSSNQNFRRKQFTFTEPSREDSLTSEAAVLVGVMLPGRGGDDGAALEELEGLAEAAGARVVGQLIQRRDAPDAATYLGKGKVEELNVLGRRRATPTSSSSTTTSARGKSATWSEPRA